MQQNLFTTDHSFLKKSFNKKIKMGKKYFWTKKKENNALLDTFCHLKSNIFTEGAL